MLLPVAQRQRTLLNTTRAPNIMSGSVILGGGEIRMVRPLWILPASLKNLFSLLRLLLGVTSLVKRIRMKFGTLGLKSFLTIWRRTLMWSVPPLI